MIDAAYDRFELMMNDQVVKTPVAISAMAGIVDADYVLERRENIGAAFIGGYSIDKRTLEASCIMEKEGRKEFICEDPIEELSIQVKKLKGSGIVAGINLRGSCPESFSDIAGAIGDKVIYEIDAHCRQQPIIDACSGEYLLINDDLLMDNVRALKKEDVQVSVKIRAGISKDDKLLAKKLWAAGADILHVDVMDYGYSKIRGIRNACPLLIIANNSIYTFEAMMDMFSHGADLVSVARRSDVSTLAGLNDGITNYADETGWYNAPKQFCRGGDIRALTFCCPPIKNCPLIPFLKKIGLSHEEYASMKQEFVKNTPLSDGANTCFGSLAWCCKLSSPCMFRNMAMQQMGLSGADYMRYKHRLSEKMMERLFNEAQVQ